MLPDKNSTNSTAPTIWIEYHTSLSVWFLFMLITGILGALLNLLLIIGIITKRSLRSGSGMLILNSLLINVVLCSIEMPMMAASAYYGEYTILSPAHYCRYMILFYYYNVYSANWAQLVIGVNRFVAVLFPHIYTTWTRAVISIQLILAPHIVPFICTAVMFFGVGAQMQSMKPWGACGLQPTPGSTVYPTVIWICVAIPIVIVFVLYSLIFSLVWTKSLASKRQVTDGAALTRQSATFRKRYRSVKMLFLSAMWYAVALIPAPIGSSFFAAQFNSKPFMQLILRALLLSCYATTPLIYLAKTADYRQRMVVIGRKLLSFFGRSLVSPTTATTVSQSVRMRSVRTLGVSAISRSLD